MNFSNEQKLEIYRDLIESRILGEKIVEYIFSGKIAGAIHPPLGQETACAALINSDKITNKKVYFHATHRQQNLMAHLLGFDPFVCELLGKQGGPGGGISGEYHLMDLDKRLLPATGALGGAWGSDVGFAWALKHDGRSNDVVVGCYGDGAISTGVTFEAMNLAALYKVPMVFMIENNGIAMSTPLSKQSPLENLAERGDAFKMKHVTVDGNDVLALTSAVLEAIETATSGEPCIVEAKGLVRWQGHYVGDRQEVYRDLTFLKNLDAIDPVKKYEQQMLDESILTEVIVAEIKAEKTHMVENAFEKAIADIDPAADQALNLDRIYANPEGSVL